MIKKIELTRGLVAEVSEEDFDILNTHKWHALKAKHTFYAARSVRVGKKRIYICMHRQIMNAIKGSLVDHIDGNGLNCAKSNLRFCNKSENGCNVPKRSGSGKFKGVCWDKQNSRFKAQIRKDGVHINIGVFNTAEEAAIAYNEFALIKHGIFANINTVNK